MFGPAFLNIIILLGVIQGFILSILLFFFKRKRLTNRLLSILIFLITLAGFNIYGESENWFNSAFLQFITQLIPLIIIMPLGPLLYFYILSYTDPSFIISKRRKWHFIPVIIDLVPQLVIFFYFFGITLTLIHADPAPYGQFIDTYNVYVDIPRWISLTVYVLVAFKHLKSLNREKVLPVKKSKGLIRWLFQLIQAFLVFQVIWLLYLVPYTIPKYTTWMLDTFWWYPVYVPLAILIYYLGLRGYIEAFKLADYDKKEVLAFASMSDENISQVHAALLESMEVNKYYLDPNLNLNSLSKLLSLNAKTISIVLNNHMLIGFNEFVNQYRIEEFKATLNVPGSEKFTITGIAYNCGFNSQATFQRTFKQITGLSPSEYIKTSRKAENHQ